METEFVRVCELEEGDQSSSNESLVSSTNSVFNIDQARVKPTRSRKALSKNDKENIKWELKRYSSTEGGLVEDTVDCVSSAHHIQHCEEHRKLWDELKQAEDISDFISSLGKKYLKLYNRFEKKRNKYAELQVQWFTDIRDGLMNASKEIFGRYWTTLVNERQHIYGEHCRDSVFHEIASKVFQFMNGKVMQVVESRNIMLHPATTSHKPDPDDSLLTRFGKIITSMVRKRKIKLISSKSSKMRKRFASEIGLLKKLGTSDPHQFPEHVKGAHSKNFIYPMNESLGVLRKINKHVKTYCNYEVFTHVGDTAFQV